MAFPTPSAKADFMLQQLLLVIENTSSPPRREWNNPEKTFPPRFMQKSPGLSKIPNKNIDCDEVYPNIFIGNEDASKQKDFLEEVGITYVLNATEKDDYDVVPIRKDSGVQYKKISMPPTRDIFNVTEIQEAADFIERALSSNGKILIYSESGYSAPPTTVIGYLTFKKMMTLADAVRTVKRKRHYIPLINFLKFMVYTRMKVFKF